MRVDLGERDEERPQPGDLPVALALLVLLLAACGGGEEDGRALVLASGRDDHGLLVQDAVGLHAAPDGRPAGAVAAGTLLRVLGTRGEWLHVRTAEGKPAEGWVNDYYLRGVGHLVGRPPGCEVVARDGRVFRPNEQVELLGLVRSGRRTWVRVRAVEGGAKGWVPREALGDAAYRGHPPERCR